MPAHLALRRKLIGFKDSAAAGHDQFGEFLKRISALQSEELLDIFGPIRIHPFLEVPIWRRLREEEWRGAAVTQSMRHRFLVELLEVRTDHGCQPELGFPSGQGVFELAGRA